jgi:hypothetical protein
MYRPIAVAVVFLALAATAFWVVRGRGEGSLEPPASVSRTGEVCGITVVRLAGPPRAKGRALGEALAPRIRAELARLLPEDTGLREFVVRTCGERLLGFVPATYREEIEGIADGAGVPFLEAFFLNTRYELAAFGLAGGEGDLAGEGAVGPGPEVGRLFDGASDLVVVVHEDLEPPLALVARPGMAGGFLGVAGGTAAALRPMRSDTPPTLGGLVWTLLLRRLLEEPPHAGDEPTFEVTGPVSVAMCLPDGAVGTLNLAVWGASWYAADSPRSLTTDEPVLAREGRMILESRDPDGRARIEAEAARLLAGPPPAGRTLLTLGGGVAPRLGVVRGGSRAAAPLRGPG